MPKMDGTGLTDGATLVGMGRLGVYLGNARTCGSRAGTISLGIEIELYGSCKFK